MIGDTIIYALKFFSPNTIARSSLSIVA